LPGRSAAGGPGRRAAAAALIASIALLAFASYYVYVYRAAAPEEGPRLVADVPGILEVITPPYLDLKYLANPFPVVVTLEPTVEPGDLEFYIVDDRGGLLRLESSIDAVGSEAGKRVVVYQLRVTGGYFEPWEHRLLVALGGAAEEHSLYIVAPEPPPGARWTESNRV
jgi:hypothetical protein